MDRPKTIGKDIKWFFRTHWPHIVIGIPAVFVFTIFHEAAHCAAVWLQNGRVTEFVWLPSGTEMGHMNYIFPPGLYYSSTAISLAPYACGAGLTACAILLSLFRGPTPFWLASTVFVWFFIAPVCDTMSTAWHYISGSTYNDFHAAFGPPNTAIAGITAVILLAHALAGYIINKRLYREKALGPAAYSILASIVVALMMAATYTRFI